MAVQNKDEIIKTLKEKIVSQNDVINTIREFFSSNSQFMKIYRQKQYDQYEKLESVLAKQEKIFCKLKELIKKE